MEKHFSSGRQADQRQQASPGTPSASGRHLPATRAPHLAGSGQRGGDRRRRPLHSGPAAAQPAPEAVDSGSAAGPPAIEAELASGPRQAPHPRRSQTRHRAAARTPPPGTWPPPPPPRRSRSAPLPGVPASLSDRLSRRDQRLGASARDDSGGAGPAPPLPPRPGLRPTSPQRSGRGADR